MTALYSHRYVMRGTIQFTTPFIIGAGQTDDVADAIFVSDANGLPAIPGSSLAGVLRSVFREKVPSKGKENSLFGFQEKDKGEGSRLSVSWGCIHDSTDVPVEGLAAPERLADPVLIKAQSTSIRDHVRINHLGASDSGDRGKFDEAPVCAGHRFTFELEMIGKEEDRPMWDDLMSLLSDPALRLGGRTRRGYGAFRFVSIRGRVFDLSKEADFSDYSLHPVELGIMSKVLKDMVLETKEQDHTGVSMELIPQGHWMFGGGNDIAGDADMAPVRDSCIVWEVSKGKVLEDVLVVPASSIKGAISHRVAFHYNALSGLFADNVEDPASCSGESNDGVRQLFGFCKDKNEGKRGSIVMDDIYIMADQAPADQWIPHVGIDRFTGGARDSVLFCERPLWGGTIPFSMKVVGDCLKDEKILLALRRTLEDLASGRLQVGAGSGRGLGRFHSTDVKWTGALSSIKEG